MPFTRLVSQTNRRLLRLPLLAVCGITLIVGCLLPVFGLAHQEKGAGVVLSSEASAKDVGLPVYPGSRRHKDKDDDSAGANLGLWGGGSGFKLVVLKMESDDSLEKVSDFYRKALAKYAATISLKKVAYSLRQGQRKNNTWLLSNRTAAALSTSWFTSPIGAAPRRSKRVALLGALLFRCVPQAKLAMGRVQRCLHLALLDDERDIALRRALRNRDDVDVFPTQ